MSTPCCASFRLTREAALTRSRDDLRLVDAYVRRNGSEPLSRRAMPPDWPTRGIQPRWPPTHCHAMEHAWHLLFGEPAFLAPLPPKLVNLISHRKVFCCAHVRSESALNATAGSRYRARLAGGESELPGCPWTDALPTAEATAKAATCASEREGGRTQAREVGKQLAEAAQTKDEHTFTSCWSRLSLRQLF